MRSNNYTSKMYNKNCRPKPQTVGVQWYFSARKGIMTHRFLCFSLKRWDINK